MKELKWPDDKEKARKVEEELKKKVRLAPLKAEPGYVAGVDAAFVDDKLIISAACLFRYPEMTPVEEKYCIKEVRFPYIPGLLSFREGPAVIEALKRLTTRPDVVLFDGQGIAHPRGLGIASYVGVLLDIPSIGCAKTRLIGRYREPGKRRGSTSRLMEGKNVIGAVVRTRDGAKPLFVSPGHLVSIDDSVRVVLGSTKGFRLAEPLRMADALSKKIKRSLE